MKLHLILTIFFSIAVSVLCAQDDNSFDIVINNGRVIDAETGLDDVRNIGISKGSISAITSAKISGTEEIDAQGLVVSPGFIDLHVHGRDNTEQEYQVHDGVTTALELEWGIEFLEKWYASRKNKALINYGASVNWPFERFLTFGSLSENKEQLQQGSVGGKLNISNAIRLLSPSFAVPVNNQQISATKVNIRKALNAGGIGIGIPIGYLPGAQAEEVYRMYQLAAVLDVPVFSHVRAGGLIAIQQAISDAMLSGASLHIVHMNSMALSEIEAAIEMVNRAQDLGYEITTEVYPYTAASTSIESSIFDGDWKDRLGIDESAVQWVETGERLNSENFAEYRDKGGTVIMHMMRPEWIRHGVASKNTIIASDGMPYAPLAHPRTAGTFSRVLGKYVREEQVLSLSEAIRKMTLLPARVLEDVAPAMRFKGRIQVGADADITIFDPELIKDMATFEGGLRFSDGIQYVLVHGQLVVRDKGMVDGVFPGRPVFGKYKR